MKEKLELLMKNENLTAGRLAELLDIQPSRISQIRAGRNKQPSFDIMQKILRRFPQINPDWLLLDSEQMYRAEYSGRSDGINPSSTPSTDLFSLPLGQTDHSASVDIGATETPTASDTRNSTSRESNISAATPEWPGISNSHASSKVERIIIIYEDGTFQDFGKR